jgi:hypothetical protein
MRRSLFVLAVGAFFGSAVTLALVFSIQSGLQNAVAQGGGAAAPLGNGDVNGDGKLNIADAIYIINNQFRGGPEPVPIEYAPTGLPATGQTRCYDGAGAEIACDSADYPGQDGFYKEGCPSEGRFVDNLDGTVTDNCTGLMWQQDTADTNGDGQISQEWVGGDRLTWEDALKYCEGLSFAGHDDWRLPNVRELQGIVDYGHGEPAIDPVLGTEADWYWSSTSYAISPDDAWHVSFDAGFVYDDDVKVSTGFIRAVRNAP